MFEKYLQQPSNQVSILAHQPPNTVREQTRSSKFRFGKFLPHAYWSYQLMIYNVARSVARHNIQNTSLEDPDLLFAEFERILVGGYKAMKETNETIKSKDGKTWWTED